MRAGWRQATRPTLTTYRAAQHRITSTARTRTIPNASQYRSLTFNDAFGLFLGPFLAAATFINLSWKEKQKKDWNQRLADVDRELETLRAREIETWNKIQLSSLSRKASRRQRRYYTTSAVAVPTTPAPETSSQIHAERQANPADEKEAWSQSIFDDAQIHPTTADPPVNEVPVRKKTSRVWFVAPAEIRGPKPLLELERLIATKLALQMQMQIYIEPPTTRVQTDEYTEKDVRSPQFASLANQLRKIATQETRFRRLQIKTQGLIAPFRATDLSDTIRDIVEQYKLGGIGPERMIGDIALVIMESSNPPSVFVYTQLMEVLHTHRFITIIPLVVNAFQNSRQAIDEVAVERLVVHIAHSRDVKAFDWCLTQLTGARSRMILSGEWEWKTVKGQALPVPKTSSPRLVQSLTRAALSLEQIWRANIWANYLDPDEAPIEHFNMIKNFIYYYTKHIDWVKGRGWVLQALASPYFTIDAAFRTPIDVPVLVFRMMALCVSCGKPTEYYQILKAAVMSGIRPPEVDHFWAETPSMNNEQAKQIMTDWTRLLDHEPTDRFSLDEDRLARFRKLLESSDLFNEEEIMDETITHDPSQPDLQSSFVKLKIDFLNSQQQLNDDLGETRNIEAKLRSLVRHHPNDLETPMHQYTLNSDESTEQRVSAKEILDQVERQRLSMEKQRQKQELQLGKYLDHLRRRFETQEDPTSAASRPSDGQSQEANSLDDVRELESISDKKRINQLEDQVAYLSFLLELAKTAEPGKDIDPFSNPFSRLSVPSNPDPPESTADSDSTPDWTSLSPALSTPDSSSDIDSGYSSDPDSTSTSPPSPSDTSTSTTR